jgi:hypothetical protein
MAAPEPRSLHGSWRLVSWTIEYALRGVTAFPFGEDADGLLIYGSDGWMSATLARRQRTPLTEPLARHEYLAYVGRWWLEGSTIVHDVVQSMNPVLIGTLQRRLAALHEQGLDLLAEETDDRGRLRRHRIRWRRAAGT